jgi:hypothetical protein
MRSGSSHENVERNNREMVHALDGARLKIVRAQEHLNTLQSEIRMYLDAKPYGISTKKHDDGEVTHYEWTPIVSTEPPLRLSVILGDCLANVRATIDYIVWQLALRYFDPPLIEADDRLWVSFPISEMPPVKDDGFTNKINRFANRKIPTSAIDIIKSVQPYHAGNEPLWWLHELVNRDKHRLPLLTIGVIEQAQGQVFFRADQVSIPLGERASWMVDTGHKLVFYGQVKTDRPLIDPRVEMNFSATVFVAFKDPVMPRIPVDVALEQIIKTVADIIPRFDSFF